MFNVKKSIAAVLCAATACACFAGCGKEETTADTNISEVTIWSQNSHSKAVFERLIGEYNEKEGKEKGIKINYIVKEGDTISQNIELAIQNGTLPEMFTSGGVMTLAEKGAIMPIEELPGGEEFLKKYEGRLANRTNVYKGKTYTVPASATTQALVYNKQMFIDAGLVDENGDPTPPETFDELREYAKKLTNPEKKQYGIIVPLKWSTFFGNDITDSLMASAGHTGFDPVTGQFDYTKIAPIIQCYVDMKNDGSVFPGADGTDNDQARAYFSNGNIGMKFGYSYDVGVYNDQFPAKIEWGVAPIPVLDKNEMYKQRLRVGNSMYISSTATKNVPGEKIMEVLKFFESDAFKVELYKEGVSAPISWDIVADVELENAKDGWKEFCELISISKMPPTNPQTDMTGQIPIKDRFLNQMWTGDSDPVENIAEYNKVVNEAMKRYYEAHPEESLDEYLDSEWEAVR